MQKWALWIGVAAVVGISAVFWITQRGVWGPPARVYTIGVVRTSPALDNIWEGFQEGMKELGYEEGANVVYRITEIGENYAETKQKVAALLEEKLDLLYPLGIFPTRAAKALTQERGLSLPILFGIAADPVGSGLVSDLMNSGNNLTGISSGNEIISSKRLELFLEMVPGIRRVIIVWNDPKTTGIELLRESAKKLGVVLVEQRVMSATEVDAFFASFAFRPGDALFRATDNITALRAKEMSQLTLAKKIPFAGTNIFDIEQGALTSYGADYRAMGKQASRLAHRILGLGDAPSSLPIELPEIFELVVNVKTAEAIGITIDPLFLARADRIMR